MLVILSCRILEGISARALSANLRKLCDYLVSEVNSINGKEFIHKCVDSINNMIWKYNVVTIDRVVLCLVLRTQEGNEARVCFLIIQLLLLKTSELRNRVTEFCKENPDHWKQNNWWVKTNDLENCFNYLNSISLKGMRNICPSIRSSPRNLLQMSQHHIHLCQCISPMFACVFYQFWMWSYIVSLKCNMSIKLQKWS